MKGAPATATSGGSPPSLRLLATTRKGITMFDKITTTDTAPAITAALLAITAKRGWVRGAALFILGVSLARLAAKVEAEA